MVTLYAIEFGFLVQSLHFYRIFTMKEFPSVANSTNLCLSLGSLVENEVVVLKYFNDSCHGDSMGIKLVLTD